MNGSSTHGDSREGAQPSIERTRRELLEFFARQRVAEDARNAPKATRSSRVPRGEDSEAPSRLDWLGLVETGMSSWWHGHPARAGALLLGSATEDYTRRKPLQAVSVAAIAGAVIVLLKPWRMVSTTAVALSLFRSSNFTGMATSVLESAAQSMQKERK